MRGDLHGAILPAVCIDAVDRTVDEARSSERSFLPSHGNEQLIDEARGSSRIVAGVIVECRLHSFVRQESLQNGMATWIMVQVELRHGVAVVVDV